MGEATRMERSYTKENLKRAKQMLKEYKHAKVRTIAYPRKRPTLLKQMKVDLTDYEKCGIVDYDWDNCMKLNIDDCFFIDQYVSDIMPCTSVYKGVFQRKKHVPYGIWTARIKFNDKHVELGTYPTEEMAAAAYNFASRIFFGEYRRENEGVEELPASTKQKLFEKAERYIERYGWYVDTEFYRSMHFAST